MSAFLPRTAVWQEDNRPHPAQLERSLLLEEQIQRWEVRAAQWRARELAEAVFGGNVRMSLLNLRHRGALRGLLRLDVPFEDLDSHLDREASFMAAVRMDPLLTRVPLLYVIGPRED
jgi:hypothetical protein